MELFFPIALGIGAWAQKQITPRRNPYEPYPSQNLADGEGSSRNDWSIGLHVAEAAFLPSRHTVL